MKIVYVAKHGNHDNCDESAIGWSLEQLGHSVTRVDERNASLITKSAGDIMLFHKWGNLPMIQQCEIPSFSWFFDLVDGTYDPMLNNRSRARMQWAWEIEKFTRLSFYTDGDWVARDPTKRRHLLQGADERVAGYGTPTYSDIPPIVFLGMTSHGTARENHVKHLEAKWGSQFRTLGGGTRSRKHGRDLANLLASTSVVIAPNGPQTDLYWSNRVYLITSLGGFLLHPLCEGLLEQYPLDILNYYEDQAECDFLITSYLNNPIERERYRRLGFEHTLRFHTYKHRCAELIKQIEEVL